MRKSLILILLILFSCQKDNLQIIEHSSQYKMIFEETESKITDGEEFSFKTILSQEHTLILFDQNNSVITKETFIPEIGINTKKIYINTLPKGRLNLILKNSIEEKKTTVIIE